MTYFAQNQASTPIAFDGASVCVCVCGGRKKRNKRKWERETVRMYVRKKEDIKRGRTEERGKWKRREEKIIEEKKASEHASRQPWRAKCCQVSTFLISYSATGFNGWWQQCVREINTHLSCTHASKKEKNGTEWSKLLVQIYLIYNLF